jgi:hypothetical protein
MNKGASKTIGRKNHQPIDTLGAIALSASTLGAIPQRLAEQAERGGLEHTVHGHSSKFVAGLDVADGLASS